MRRGTDMKKWHMIIDVERCEDCNTCFIACKDEHCGNTFTGYTREQPKHGHRWINIFRKERGSGSLTDVFYMPVPCMHCNDPKCASKAKNNAITKRGDGIVLIDPDKAKGQKELAGACPYGAIFWNEEMNLPQKCTFCAHLIDDKWKAPRCVQACPTGALRAICVEEEDLRKTIEKEGLQVLKPELGTNPNVFYKNCDLFTKAFIAGSVATRVDGVCDCLEGARVTLSKDAKKIGDLITDNYGDFKFDGLEEGSGTYVITIKAEGFAEKTIEVRLSESIYLGDIYL
jgi:Fe-S-cluster-containing dehydrogenase component